MRLRVYYLGAADGTRDVAVAAANQKFAAALLGVPLGYFRRYGGHSVGDTNPVFKLALSTPGRAWRRVAIERGTNRPGRWEQEPDYSSGDSGK